MCSLAPRAAAPDFGAPTFLDRQRGVVAVVAPAGETTRRHARASEASAAPARKRGHHDTSEHVVDDPAAAASSALRIRMDGEFVALQGLLKRAKLLPRSAPAIEEKCAAAPTIGGACATVLSSPSKPAKQQRPESSPSKPAKQQHPEQRAAAKMDPKKRRPEEELARAAAREKFRQMLREMEKTALPDETVYPEDLAKLGIPFEFNMTRTWKQACLDAKRVELVARMQYAS